MADRKMTLEALRALAREIDRHVKAGGVTSPQAAVPMRGQQQQQQNPGARPLVVTLRVVDETGSSVKTRAGRDAAEAKRKKARGESAVERTEKRRAETGPRDYLEQMQVGAGFHSSINPLRVLTERLRYRGLAAFGQPGMMAAHYAAIASSSRNGMVAGVGKGLGSFLGAASIIGGAITEGSPVARAYWLESAAKDSPTIRDAVKKSRELEGTVNEIAARISAIEGAFTQSKNLIGSSGLLAGTVSNTAQINTELAKTIPGAAYELETINKRVEARRESALKEAISRGVIRTAGDVLGKMFRK